MGFDLPGVTADDNSFGQVRGTGPLGWWVFGFALGTASGALLRRTVPAMVVTVGAIVAATIARNLFFATLAVEQSSSSVQQAQRIETVILIGVSLIRGRSPSPLWNAPGRDPAAAERPLPNRYLMRYFRSACIP